MERLRCLTKLSIFDISCLRYCCLDGIGMFFIEYPKFILSNCILLKCRSLKVLDKQMQGAVYQYMERRSIYMERRSIY